MKTAEDIKTNSASWSAPPLWAPLSGHLMLAVVKAPIAVLLLWLATLPGWVRSVPIESLIAAVAGAAILGEILTTLAERPFILKRRLSAPGGWDYALTPLLVQAIAGLIIGFIVFRGLKEAAILAACYMLTTVAEILITKSWLPGDTQAQIDEKWQKTKDMTRETFSDEIEHAKKRAAEKSRNKY